MSTNPTSYRHFFGSPPATAVAGKVGSDGSITSTHSFFQAGRPAADRAPRPDAVPGAALPPRRAGAELQSGVPSETADDVPPGLGGRNRGTRRSDGMDLADEGVLAGTAEAAPREWRLLCDARTCRRSHAPPGLVFRAVEVLPEGSRKARVQSAAYEAPIPATRRAGLGERIERLLAASSWPIERARGARRSTCARWFPSWRWARTCWRCGSAWTAAAASAPARCWRPWASPTSSAREFISAAPPWRSAHDAYSSVLPNKKART